MKKILTLIVLAGFVTFTACKKDETVVLDSPSITVPTGTQVEFGGETTLSFTVTAPGKIASATATGGTVVDEKVGETSTTIDVTFTAGTTSGNETVTLTVTDAQSPAKTTEAVATVEVLEEITEVTVTSNISSDVTWTADKTYILATRVTVLDGATLTIEPGTVIKGEAGVADNATALLVARGGTLMAEGTASAPIIFTSIADEITPEDVAAGNFESPNLTPDINGLWGGVIVLGYAHISASNDDGDLTEIQIEGIPASDTNGLYGGTDDADNSGSIAYISIRHGGTNIGSGNEINGLSLGGVGTGTSISNVEIVANQDDGIEFFGGTVNIDGVLVWNQGDDGLDTDQAWNGTCSNFALITPAGGSGFELDGPEGSYINGPHTFDGGVLYAGDGIAALIDFDQGSKETNAIVKNLYINEIVQGDVQEYVYNMGYQEIENLEYTFGADATETDPAVVFENVDPAELSAVAENQNTVGYTADFSWTWASQSGELAAIGLE